MANRSNLDVLRERLEAVSLAANRQLWSLSFVFFLQIKSRAKTTSAQSMPFSDESEPSSDPETEITSAQGNLTALFQPDASSVQSRTEAVPQDQSSLNLIGFGSHEITMRAQPHSATTHDQPDLLSNLSQLLHDNATLHDDAITTYSQLHPDASDTTLGDFPSFAVSHRSTSQPAGHSQLQQSHSSPPISRQTNTNGSALNGWTAISANQDGLSASVRSTSTASSRGELRGLNESLAQLGFDDDDMKDLLSVLPPLNPDSDFVMTQEYLDEVRSGLGSTVTC